jgi:hypothetical protein
MSHAAPGPEEFPSHPMHYDAPHSGADELALGAALDAMKLESTVCFEGIVTSVGSSFAIVNNDCYVPRHFVNILHLQVGQPVRVVAVPHSHGRNKWRAKQLTPLQLYPAVAGAELVMPALLKGDDFQTRTLVGEVTSTGNGFCIVKNDIFVPASLLHGQPVMERESIVRVDAVPRVSGRNKWRAVRAEIVSSLALEPGAPGAEQQGESEAEAKDGGLRHIVGMVTSQGIVKHVDALVKSLMFVTCMHVPCMCFVRYHSTMCAHYLDAKITINLKIRICFMMTSSQLASSSYSEHYHYVCSVIGHCYTVIRGVSHSCHYLHSIVNHDVYVPGYLLTGIRRVMEGHTILRLTVCPLRAGRNKWRALSAFEVAVPEAGFAFPAGAVAAWDGVTGVPLPGMPHPGVSHPGIPHPGVPHPGVVHPGALPHPAAPGREAAIVEPQYEIVGPVTSRGSTFAIVNYDVYIPSHLLNGATVEEGTVLRVRAVERRVGRNNWRAIGATIQA